jgi:hypothetical protein
VERVFIIGHLPPKISPDRVEFIPTPQEGTKFANIGENLEAVMESHISEEFIWLNDDFMLLEDFTGPMPVWARELPMREHIERLHPGIGSAEHRAFVLGLITQFEILLEWGFDDPMCADLHLPIPLEKLRLKAITSRVWAEYPLLERGHFRALYGAGLELEPVADVKHSAHRGFPEAVRGWVSSSPVAWNVGELGRVIRKRYWRPSRWEVGSG